ncbi:uncharacterized protein LOC101240776 isoform X5 [Hydra vulgaris]|uniref:Uncharacterized protein LOC101240776 isoform X5 n=1 Tax=Hydra vulgaris TaxID=6087 RepID=A0ABM4D4L2_HYDVU
MVFDNCINNFIIFFFVVFHVSAYSGESESFDDSESGSSGEYQGVANGNDGECKKIYLNINQGTKNFKLDRCSLTSAFKIMGFGEMDPSLNQFLKPETHSFNCYLLQEINQSKQSKSVIHCNINKFTALPRGNGTIDMNGAKLEIHATDNIYKNIELKLYEDFKKNNIITKDAGSNNIKLDYFFDGSTFQDVETFLDQHFGFNYNNLTKFQEFNKFFPNSWRELSFTALFAPNFEFVEIIFWNKKDSDNTFFIFQSSTNSDESAVGFFKILDDYKSTINQALGIEVDENLLPMLKKFSSSCFSSCTSEIIMVFSNTHHDIIKSCITEESNVIMPKGVTLRWKNKSKNTVKIPSVSKDGTIVGGSSEIIGFSAQFFKVNDVTVANVTSYDNITSTLQTIIDNFLPQTLQFQDDDDFKLVLEKRAFFQMIYLSKDIVSLHCVLDEDWSIADELIQLKGLNLNLIVPLNNLQPTNNQIFSGNGEILVIGQMVEVKIEKGQAEYFLSADFIANNLSMLTEAAKVSFLPDNDYDKFQHLKSLPLSSLILKIKLNSKVLKFQGTSLSYANVSDKGVPNFSTLEIVLYNKNKNANMVVGICQEFVFFEKFVKEILDINLEGVPWLAFENFCFLVAKEEDSINKQHFNTEMYPVLKEGIGYKGRISYDNIVCQTIIKADGVTQVLNNYEDMCNFIKNKTNDFMKFIGGEGSISQSLFNFKTIVNTDQAVVLKIGSLQMINPSFSLKEVYQYTYKVTEKSPKIVTPNTKHTKLQRHNHHSHKRSHRNIKRSDETQNVEKITTRMFGVVIEGDVKDTSTKFECKGALSSYESGQLILNCTDAKISISYSEITNSQNVDKDVLFEASQGKSVVNNFSIFEFHSQMNVIYEDRIMKIENGSLTFNLLNIKDTYFSAQLKDVKDFKTILRKFQIIRNMKRLPLYIFSGSKFYESALLVWSGKDSVIAAASNRTARASTLNLFGSVNRSLSAVDFKMTVKKCFVRYVEWLPVMNVSMSKFIVYNKNKNKTTIGPKLRLEWNWCKCNKNSNSCNQDIKSINISGNVETIGISGKFEIILDKDGYFDTTMNHLFFNEVQAYINIKQEASLETLNQINPKLYVNLIQDDKTKFFIKNTVKNHFKTLANEFVSLYNGNSFSLINIKAEDLLYHPTKKIIDAIKPINDMIADQILAIESINKVMSRDCVEECIASPVNIPGIVTQQNSEGISFKWLPNNQRAINVSCVTDCEIIKSNENENLDDKINKIKKEIIIYDKLVGEAKELTDFYSTFEETTRSSYTAFESHKKKYEQLFNLLNKDVKEEVDFFQIEKFEINANVADIMMLGQNCVQNFKAKYTMFNQPKEFTFCQCFNGEYATYFANKVVENYLGDEFPNLKAFYEFHDSYVVKQEVYYKSLEDNLTNFYEKYGNIHVEDVEESPSQRFTVQFNDSLLDSSEVLNFHTKKLYLPLLAQSKRGLLDENHYAITRSIKTRKAFLYSSPWAALSVFDLENSLKGAQLVVRALPTNKSHCHTVSESGNQYIGLYSSIRSISDSYSQTKDQLSLIHQSMQNETNVLKKYTVGTSSETNIDQLYWIRQLERGTQLFYDLTQKKLSTYSSHALAAFKTKFERALKRNGFLNIGRFIKKLKEQVQTASRSVKKTSGMAAVSRLSEAIVSLFSKPNQKLDLVANRIKEMEKYVMNINGMVRTCKH